MTVQDLVGACSTERALQETLGADGGIWETEAICYSERAQRAARVCQPGKPNSDSIL